MDNIVLIGMPGCGKSSCGVILAKVTGHDFIDTDVFLQAREGQMLQQMIDTLGVDAFLKKEEAAILALNVNGYVVATGGSVVYSEKAVAHLRQYGTLVYIRLPYEEIESRLSNLATRGVTLREGQTLRDLYDERTPLYEAAADLIINAQGQNIEETVSSIKSLLLKKNGV